MNCTKRPYASKTVAIAAAIAINRAGTIKRSMLAVYFCRECRSWNLTSKRVSPNSRFGTVVPPGRVSG